MQGTQPFNAKVNVPALTDPVFKSISLFVEKMERPIQINAWLVLQEFKHNVMEHAPVIASYLENNIKIYICKKKSRNCVFGATKLYSYQQFILIKIKKQLLYVK